MDKPDPIIKVEDIFKIYRRHEYKGGGYFNEEDPSQDNAPLCEQEEGDIYALNGVSLEIARNEFVSIVGHSGSGKSTLMNILGCLDNPSSGRYLLKDRDVAKLSQGKLSRIRNHQIGFIFQGFNLVPTLNALENVEMPLTYRGESKQSRRQKAYESLKRVGLAHRINHKPGEMSGGQQQRVAIARAIAARPPIILADEPTGNLDRTAGADIIEILMELQREGHTIVLITHDEEISRKTDRIINIKNGQVI